MTLNCINYKIALALAAADIPVSALIAAALLKADTQNAGKINQEWPTLARQLYRRHHSADGVLPGESHYPTDVAKLSARANEVAASYLSRVGVQQ